MRILILMFFVVFGLYSCSDESKLINTLGCQATITYSGIDECYQMHAFVNEKNEILIPTNLEFFYDEADLVIGSAYISGYNPVNDVLAESGQCENNTGKQAVKISCIDDL